jgi:hypothetical protein
MKEDLERNFWRSGFIEYIFISKEWIVRLNPDLLSPFAPPVNNWENENHVIKEPF